MIIQALPYESRRDGITHSAFETLTRLKIVTIWQFGPPPLSKSTK
ncbi:MAG: hypothetical protein ACXVCO_08400 [Ktedonobacterales bacterium]